MAEIASKRSMENLTVGPVLTWSTEAMLGHVDKLLKIPGTAPALAASFLAAHAAPNLPSLAKPLLLGGSGRAGRDVELVGIRALLVRGM